MDAERQETNEQNEMVGIPLFFISETGKSEIKVKKSRVFGFLLESNHSTGFSWHLKKEVTGNIIRFLGVTDLDSEDRKSRKLGSREFEKHVFESMGAGKIILEFQYHRPWEKDKPPLKKAVVIITVEN